MPIKHLIWMARLCFVFLFLVGAAETFGTEKPETPHLVFVTEYIRELTAVEDIRASGEQELAQDKANIFSSMIHSATLFQLEFGSEISSLQGMRLKDPFDKVIPTIITLDNRKIALWQRMIEIGGAFVGGQTRC